jgi:hypothetical protein
MNGTAFSVSWSSAERETLHLSANLTAQDAHLPPSDGGTLVFAHGRSAAAALAQGELPPWSVVCRLD